VDGKTAGDVWADDSSTMAPVVELENAQCCIDYFIDINQYLLHFIIVTDAAANITRGSKNSG
jgi:hypothetical protein